MYKLNVVGAFQTRRHLTSAQKYSRHSISSRHVYLTRVFTETSAKIFQTLLNLCSNQYFFLVFITVQHIY